MACHVEPTSPNPLLITSTPRRYFDLKKAITTLGITGDGFFHSWSWVKLMPSPPSHFGPSIFMIELYSKIFTGQIITSSFSYPQKMILRLLSKRNRKCQQMQITSVYFCHANELSIQCEQQCTSLTCRIPWQKQKHGLICSIILNYCIQVELCIDRKVARL